MRLRNKHCGTCRNSNKMIHRTRKAVAVRSLSLSLSRLLHYTASREARTFLMIGTYYYAVFILYTRDLNSQVYEMSQEKRSIIVHQEFIHKGLIMSKCRKKYFK